MPHILLHNATILVPSGKTADYVVPLRRHSLLIKDNEIAQIAPQITPPDGAQVIDCTDKIVSPGFIDTHHHLWQTQLKGRHADQSLLEYMPNGNAQSVYYSPQDVFWGVLGGCLEALDAGTTTVVDHAHINVSPAHSIFACLRGSFKTLLTVIRAQLQMMLRRPLRLVFAPSFAMDQS